MQADQALKYLSPKRFFTTLANWSWEQYCAALIFCFTILYCGFILLGSFSLPVGSALAIQSIPVHATNLSFASAEQSFNQSKQVNTELKNGLNAQWYWLRFKLHNQASSGATTLILNQGNLVSASCQGLTLHNNDLFWYADLSEIEDERTVVCKLWLVGSGRVQVHAVSREWFQTLSAQQVEKNLLLQGILLTLVTLTIASAIATKKRVFLAYGIWLLFSLQRELMTLGHDFSLFDWSIPLNWLPTWRAVSYSVYMFSSVWLLVELLQLSLLAIRPVIKISVWVGFLGLLLLALLTPLPVFLAVMIALAMSLAVVSFVLLAGALLRRYPVIVTMCFLGLLLVCFALLIDLLSVWLPKQFTDLGFIGYCAPLLFSFVWYALTLLDHDEKLIGSVRDITSEKNRESELRYQINHDELTGALNRRGLHDGLVEHQLNGVDAVVLAFIDIKRFRNVVKAHGLALADQLLVRFYLLILQTIGHCGEVVRFGHDQFMVLQADQRFYDRHLEALQNLVTTLRQHPLVVDGVHTTIQVQVGVMHLPLSADHHGLLSLVEDLAHEMKFRFRQSGQSYLLFTQEESLKLIQAARLSEQILNQGLPDNLFLCWQPILNISGDHCTLSAEALLRQTDDQGQYHSAGSVIETCCNRGRTALLDIWVLGQTLNFLEKNFDQLDHLLGVGVNVSPYSLNDDSFLSTVIDLFKQAARVCQKVYLEVTEVGTILNPEAVNRFVSVIRTMGVRVSLDDFGAGFSNFQYVIDLKADVIKIDGSIASQVQSSVQSRSVVKAIVNLAQDLSCTTVAEGVTDLATYQELKILGVDFLQGFLVSRAVPPEQFLDKLNCQNFYNKLWVNGQRDRVNMA